MCFVCGEMWGFRKCLRCRKWVCYEHRDYIDDTGRFPCRVPVGGIRS